MARISKPGLDYFPLDVNFLQDRKVRRITSRHHAAGIAALTSLLSLIYKEKGYYVSWNQDTLFDIAQEICCEEKEMQAIIDDCLSVGFFDTYIYKEYKVLTSQSIQEQYYKIITDSRRKYKLPLEHFWLIKDEDPENERAEMSTKNTGNGISAAEIAPFATTIPQTKQQTESENREERERDKDRDRDREIKPRTEIDRETPKVYENTKPWETNGKETKTESESETYSEPKRERDRDRERERENESKIESDKPHSPSNCVSQATPVAVEGLSLDLLQLNMKAIGIQNQQTIQAITALARRKELGGQGGILWKILSSEYRPTLLKKNEPGDYILWALHHPTEFENTYNSTLKKLVRGR